MRPSFSFCGSPTYQLSKYLTTILQPLTDKSRRKLQSTEDFINATKTVQIPDNYKLVSFDLKSLFTSIQLQLALQCTETAILQSTDPLPLPTEEIMDLLKPLPDINLLSVQRQTLQIVTRYSYGVSSFCCCSRNCDAEHREKRPFDLLTDDITLVMLRWRYFHHQRTRRNRRIPPPLTTTQLLRLQPLYHT